MDHICVSSLHLMNHGHTQPRFGVSKFNVGNQVSFESVGINSNSSTLHTFVGTKSFISKEELAIPTMKYSQLVGGFVGSKSQVRTSNRISCQIWDVVFCKLMSFMNSSNMKSASSLESSEYSYAFVENLPTDVFDSMYRDISEHNTPPARGCALKTDTQACNNFTPVKSEKHNLTTPSAVLSNPITMPLKEFHGAKFKESCKQSYADVTRTAKHTDTMNGNVKHENIICSNGTVKTKNVQIIPVRELNTTSKRKKQKCRRKKANISDGNAIKPQNSCKSGAKHYKNDSRKTVNLKVQNGMKMCKNISAPNMKMHKNISAPDMIKEVTKNTKCDVDDPLIIFTNKPISEITSLDYKKGQNSCTSMLPKCNKGEFEFASDYEKNLASPHMMVIPNGASQNCSEKDTVFDNRMKEEHEFLPKKPSFSHFQEIFTPKTNRFHSDSSDSDDSIIFEKADSDVQIDSASEEDIFSDCDIEERWDTLEEDIDEVDNQVTEKLRSINEKWEKMYSCFPGKPKEPKKVQFASNKNLESVHSIIAWDFAYRAARIGCWQQIVLDKQRFMRRIQELEQIISPVLTTEHRLCVHQRIMKYSSEVHSDN